MSVQGRGTVHLRLPVLAAVLLLAGPVTGFRLVPLAKAQTARPARSRNSQAAGEQGGQLDERCANFLKWSRQLEEAYPGQDLYRTAITPAMVVPLFGDPAFVPYFGKPYDQLSSEDRQDIMKNTISPCLNSEHRRDFTWQMATLRTAFLPSAPQNYPLGATQLITAVVALRQARADLARIKAELGSLTASADAYKRLLADKESAAKSLRLVWPSEQAEFNAAMNGAVARVPQPVEPRGGQSEPRFGKGTPGQGPAVRASNSSPRTEAGIASSVTFAQAETDCSRIDQVARHVLGNSRMIVTPMPSGGNSCNVQLRDSGLTNSSVGTLTVTTYGGTGPLLTDYRRSTDRCETIDALGQMAELCVFSEDYYHHRLSLVVYRNERRVLDLNFVDWPSPPNPARDEARSLADGILGPYAPAPLKQPVVSKSGAPEDRAEQLKRELAPKAESGNGEAEFALGMLYQYNTRGADGKLSPDYPAAAYWYQRAAAAHITNAAYALGLLNRDGRGVQKNESAAMRLFKEAAEAGNVPAMTALGTLYATKGPAWASYYLPWLNKAADASDADAMNELGVMSYVSGREGGVGMEVFRQRDYDSAMKEYRRAAAAGNCEAYMNIGGLYFNGDGVPQDKRQAESWFAKAEACARANNSDILEKASKFRQKASNGELPAVEAATSSASKMSAGEIILWGIGLGAAVAAIAHASSSKGRSADPCSTCMSAGDMDRMNDQQEKEEQDREHQQQREQQEVERQGQFMDRLSRCGYSHPNCL